MSRPLLITYLIQLTLVYWGFTTVVVDDFFTMKFQLSPKQQVREAKTFVMGEDILKQKEKVTEEIKTAERPKIKKFKNLKRFEPSAIEIKPYMAKINSLSPKALPEIHIKNIIPTKLPKIAAAQVMTRKNDKKLFGVSTNLMKVIARENKKVSQATFQDRISTKSSTFKKSKRFANVKIKAFTPLTDKKGIGEISQFSYERGIEYGKMKQSHQYGHIKVKENLNKGQGIIYSAILAHGYYETNFDLMLYPESYDYRVPMIKRDYFKSVLKIDSDKMYGGHLLLKVNENIKGYDVDAKYAFKKNLDKNFRLTNKNPHYILFLGVEVGNAILTYNLGKKDEFTKIIFMDENKILYEESGYFSRESEVIDLFEEKILAKSKVPLDIPSRKIRPLLAKNNSAKAGPNQYRVDYQRYSDSTRLYFTLDHLDKDKDPDDRVFLVLGKWDESRFTVPSQLSKDAYFRFFGVRDLSNMCLVQINLDTTRKLKRVNVESYAPGGNINFEVHYMTKDGQLNKEFSSSADKIFIVGDTQGIFNLAINYQNGSSDFLKTFCSDETYLIEQY